MIVATPYKQLISAIPYTLSANSLLSADVVILNDSKLLVDTLYSINTKIFMDNDFKSDISGENLARELVAQGFNNIYILSRSHIKDLRSKYPEIVKFIEKGSETFMDDLIYYVTCSGMLKKGTV